MIQYSKMLFHSNDALLWLLILILSLAVQADNSRILPNDDPFYQALYEGDDVQALSLGQLRYKDIQQAMRNDADFRAFDSKLIAAKFLAQQMISQLTLATRQQMLRVAEPIFSTSMPPSKFPLSLAPALKFYDTSVSIFSYPVRITGLTKKQKTFLGTYYNLELRILIGQIARSGQALAIAEPTFFDTYYYVLVLPLLHTGANETININVLPGWMTKPQQLDLLADACLLHFNLPYQAMNLARTSASHRNQKFSPIAFYRNAAKKCGLSRANLAVACLQNALDHSTESTIDTTIALQFEIAQIWWDAGNFPLAAGQAQSIFQAYPDAKDYGRAVNLYYYSLSRGNNIKVILSDIDTAIDDPRCIAYQAKLMYLKWWALRRQRKDDARIAAIEYALLKRYPKNPLVAPVLLSRATDNLGRQDYLAARMSLEKLVEQFPATKSGAQAKKMLAKLQNAPTKKG